ncbi:hypothetical protein K474DRAFT_1590001 [Panus rudis PR-1116 ss-1]|nr:hypothetical protein K474DRAFT_1590001 [Panus rudis PR-1116 ss-1]
MSTIIQVYNRASDLPQFVWKAFQARPQATNIVYAHAEKLKGEESSLEYPPNQLWLTCVTKGLAGEQRLDFVLACFDDAREPSQHYPVFIVTWRPYRELQSKEVYHCLEQLADKLYRNEAVGRIFSVFAPDPVAHTFAEIWKNITGINIESPPYYAASLMSCARPRNNTTQLPMTLRLATMQDAGLVAALCKGFADESEPYTLDDAGAYSEATRLINDGVLWVCLDPSSNTAKIACIVAAARVTETVSAITKVYTLPECRGHKYAQYLTNYVVHELLKSKKSVVLYVSHGNNAKKVYERVGFVELGLEEEIGSGDSCKWCEIGFDRRRVDLGHW